jgi:hypothetical protein
VTLRIEKAADTHKTIIGLDGQLQSEYLDALKVQVKGDEQSSIALDPKDMALVEKRSPARL